jgi:hypothetical protein
MAPKKFYLTFKKIVPTDIDEKYEFSLLFNLHKKKLPENCTKIQDLSSIGSNGNKISSLSTPNMSSSQQTSIQSSTSFSGSIANNNTMTFSFLDESKKDHHCVVTMLPHFNENNLPKHTLLHCFWCRHSFSSHPVGCPIKYNPHRLIKTYDSEITKDTYTLRENISSQQMDEGKEYYMKEKIEFFNRDYFVTDGVFCSFNCALAFILDNKTNPLYIFSANLLMKMYYETYSESSIPLEPAPSWRLLATYGGHMSIEDFRKNFSKVEYQDIDNILVNFPQSKSIGILFEKQIKI